MKLSSLFAFIAGYQAEEYPQGQKLKLGKVPSLRAQFKEKKIDYSNDDLTRHLTAKFGEDGHNEAITNYMDAQVIKAACLIENTFVAETGSKKNQAILVFNEL